MAADTRKLKDLVTELFKKGKFEKAAAALEDLIKAEPRENQHRLKLGDALRKSGERDRAIVAYQAAAKAYADEGQLIKGIAAVKVILEIDPANQAAQAQLAEMNERRFAKPGQFAQKAAAPRAIGARAISSIELDEADAATSAVASQMADPLDPSEAFQRDTEPLELDEPSAELDLVEVQPEPEPIEIELLEADAPPNTAPIRVQATVAPAQGRVEARASFELDLEVVAPRPKTGPQPIADLLATSDEEEVELLSISSDEEMALVAPAPPRKLPVRVPLFSELSQEAFVELVNRLDYRVYEPGQVILREGDPGRSFYVISEGRVRVFKHLPDGSELTLAHLEDGAFFGEMAMLSGAPRTATIAAEIETHLLEVSDKVLRSLVQKHPQVTTTLKNFYRQRLLNNVMTISPLFKGFDAAERKTLMERFRMRQAAQGEVLVEQGKKSDGLYVVLHGAVNVTAKAPNGAVDIARLKEGDIFGEMSLLTRQPSIATVAAAVPSLVLKLPREQFSEMISTHPQILELVSELTDQRRSATEAILAGQGPGVDGMAFV